MDEVEWLIKAYDKVKWLIYKLPNDHFYLENATILQRLNRYPLIIDPEGQSIEFIELSYISKKLIKISFTSNKFMKILENALRYGYINSRCSKNRPNYGFNI